MKKKLFEKIKETNFQPIAETADKSVWYIAEMVGLVFIALVVSVFAGLAVFKIMAVGGLAFVFADLMVFTCTTTGIPCEINTLMGGIGLALVVLTSLVIATARIVTSDQSFFNGPEYEYLDGEPSRVYNDQQVYFLRFIQALGGLKNLRKYANVLDIPYTTAKNHVDQFERDGYVKIHSNGQGSQLDIEVLKK